MKICTKCKVEKPLSAFGKDAARGVGVGSWCKACGAAASRAWKDAHPEKAAAAARAWAKAHPEKKRQYNGARRARKRNAEGALPPDIVKMLLARQHCCCACCGTRLKETGYHLDHRVPLAKGGSHTEDNVQLLTPKCNLSKGTKDWDEFLKSRRHVQAATDKAKQAA